MNTHNNGIDCVPNDGSVPDNFRRLQNTYREVFTLLGADTDDTNTLDRAVQVSQTWIRGDYGYNDSLPVQLNDTNRETLRRLCEDDLAMGPAWDLPEGNYDTLLVFGASQFGNVRRSEQVARLLQSPAHSFGRLVLLGGERNLYQKEIPGTRRLLHGRSIQKEARQDSWLADVVDQFDAHFPEGCDPDSIDLSLYQQFGETLQMRVSVIAAMGAIIMRTETHALNVNTGKQVGVNEFDVTMGDRTFGATLLHCPPHPRKNGPDRHTTESCVGDFTNVLGISSGETVAFVGAQPHLFRMQMTVLRAFKRLGYGGVQVIATGPKLDEGTPVQICASEVYKTLYEMKALRDAPAP